MALVDAKYRFVCASVWPSRNTNGSTLLQLAVLRKRNVGGEMIPNVVEQVKDVEINPLILGGGEFQLWTFMLKPHGDAILPGEKQYFNWQNSQTKLVTEGAFRGFKIRFRVLLRKYESNKETAKLYSLTCVVSSYPLYWRRWFSSNKVLFNFGSCVK